MKDKENNLKLLVKYVNANIGAKLIAEKLNVSLSYVYKLAKEQNIELYKARTPRKRIPKNGTNTTMVIFRTNHYVLKTIEKYKGNLTYNQLLKKLTLDFFEVNELEDIKKIISPEIRGVSKLSKKVIEKPMWLESDFKKTFKNIAKKNNLDLGELLEIITLKKNKK